MGCMICILGGGGGKGKEAHESRTKERGGEGGDPLLSNAVEGGGGGKGKREWGKEG